MGFALILYSLENTFTTLITWTTDVIENMFYYMPAVLFAQANEQLQVVRESHAATSKEVADAHR